MSGSDLHAAFPAPLMSAVMTVEPQWIDYNGHLNMAYYHVLFDRAVDEAFTLLGIGPEYVQSQRRSCFAAEVHVRYLRELRAGDPVRVAFQLLDYDAKRLHLFETMTHAEHGWIAATAENMSLHVDMEAKRTAPFPGDVMERLERLKAAHAPLPRPQGAGRNIAMRSGG